MMSTYLGVIVTMASVVILSMISFEYTNYKDKRAFLEAMYQIKEEEVRNELDRIRSLVDGVKTFKNKQAGNLTFRVKSGKEKTSKHHF